MLQYPTNVSPENTAFDPNVIDENNRVLFTFNGDILTAAFFRIYDYTTGELASDSFYAKDDRTPIRYNGEILTFSNGTLSDLKAGHDYVWQMMLTQSSTDGSENIYDMPVLNGEIQTDYTSGSTSIFIENKITNIYEWETRIYLHEPTILYDKSYAGMIIKVNNTTAFIESYNSDTGELIIDNAFNFDITTSTRYQIYSNYIISPQYYFKCKSTPVVSLDLKWGGLGLECTGTYKQTENSLIKYYTLSLYKGNDIASAYLLEDTSDVTYSQNIKWLFPDYYTYNPYDINDEIGGYYKVVCSVVTQDDMNYTTEYTVNTAPLLEDSIENVQIYINNDVHNLALFWNQNKHDYSKIYRINVKERPEATLIGLTTTGGFHDLTVSNNGDYRYIIVPFNNAIQDDAVGKPYISDIVSTKWEGYTITALVDKDKKFINRSCYSYGDTWRIIGNIEDTTVTQNTDKTLHVGSGKYSSVTSSEVNYMSGTLSAMLMQINCTSKEYTDTIEQVRAWRKFITQPCPFILKSPKGDVWIVNVTDNPTTTYQENSYSIPTTFSFSWAECMDSNDILLVDGNVLDLLL